MVPNKLQISNPICTFQLFQVIIVESKQIKMFPSTLKHVQVFLSFLCSAIKSVTIFRCCTDIFRAFFFQVSYIILGFH